MWVATKAYISLVLQVGIHLAELDKQLLAKAANTETMLPLEATVNRFHFTDSSYSSGR